MILMLWIFVIIQIKQLDMMVILTAFITEKKCIQNGDNRSQSS